MNTSLKYYHALLSKYSQIFDIDESSDEILKVCGVDEGISESTTGLEQTETGSNWRLSWANVGGLLNSLYITFKHSLIIHNS